MNSVPKLLVKTQAFRDLDNPVILTSGALGVYYINTEKLYPNGNKWEGFGDDSRAMIADAVSAMNESDVYKSVISSVADEVKRALYNKPQPWMISGGQRRDWLFSGPVAQILGLPHISVYKDERVEVILPNNSVGQNNLKGVTAVHVVDLITEGSSVYRVENGVEKGWVPALRSRGVRINDLVSIVSRKQGGEESLEKQGVWVKSFVSVDEDFLKNYSKNPSVAVAYNKNPEAWSVNYVKENGLVEFVNYFKPGNDKLDRAKKFFHRYESFLTDGQLSDFRSAVNSSFNVSLEEVLG